MDQEHIREMLTSLLTDVAAKAREDSLAGRSDIGSIFRREGEGLNSLDPQKVEDAIADINRATSTKEGARRIINGLMVVAKAAARVAFPS